MKGNLGPGLTKLQTVTGHLLCLMSQEITLHKSVVSAIGDPWVHCLSSSSKSQLCLKPNLKSDPNSEWEEMVPLSVYEVYRAINPLVFY